MTGWPVTILSSLVGLVIHWGFPMAYHNLVGAIIEKNLVLLKFLNIVALKLNHTAQLWEDWVEVMSCTGTQGRKDFGYPGSASSLTPELCTIFELVAAAPCCFSHVLCSSAFSKSLPIHTTSSRHTPCLPAVSTWGRNPHTTLCLMW